MRHNGSMGCGGRAGPGAPGLAVLAVLCLLGARTAGADTIHVPRDYPTIQEAIDNAQNGDCILVEPGTYVENLNFLGKAITVRGEGGPEETTIRASGNQSSCFDIVLFENAPAL